MPKSTDPLIQLFSEGKQLSVRDIDLLLGEKHTFAIGMLSNRHPHGTATEKQEGYYQVPHSLVAQYIQRMEAADGNCLDCRASL